MRVAAEQLFGLELPAGRLPTRSVRNVDFQELLLEHEGRVGAGGKGGKERLRWRSAPGTKGCPPARPPAFFTGAGAAHLRVLTAPSPPPCARAGAAALRQRLRLPQHPDAHAQDQAGALRVRLPGGHGLPRGLPQRRRPAQAARGPGACAAAGGAGGGVPQQVRRCRPARAPQRQPLQGRAPGCTAALLVPAARRATSRAPPLSSRTGRTCWSGGPRRARRWRSCTGAGCAAAPRRLLQGSCCTQGTTSGRGPWGARSGTGDGCAGDGG
jgi:hypothetical protein